MRNVGPDRQQGALSWPSRTKIRLCVSKFHPFAARWEERDRSLVALGCNVGTNEVRDEHSKLVTFMKATPLLIGRTASCTPML